MGNITAVAAAAVIAAAVAAAAAAAIAAVAAAAIAATVAAAAARTFVLLDPVQHFAAQLLVAVAAERNLIYLF